ncbi:AlpA family phage regulatory protein [Paraburkholderia sp. SARCC-3016]|uniref:helix-turn-helix transcriptional regulator n=1 Tax=Paraburkholderia sp. SARCC-3016 TaxID=3058611 RepID=UPI0028072C36|nr:AlpA family phage regulatory protein [Paraburkholderia sp. SARCC-3016]MDQ7978697.1 AlpA family phage regulatory protein [Paraburkholderia sp. SARCC-3016]
MSAVQASLRGLRPAKAAEKLGIGLSTLWLKTKNQADFPKPVKIGPSTTIFLEHELDAYIATCAAARKV